jgi:hypothetical protein
MRISTGQLYDRTIQSVLDNQADLSDIQQQLASGKKLLRPSDDPVGAAQVVRLTEQIDRINQYKKNSNLLVNSLEQEETVLKSVNTAVDRARVLMLQSGSGIVGTEDRTAIANEINQIKDQVFDLMNSRNPFLQGFSLARLHLILILVHQEINIILKAMGVKIKFKFQTMSACKKTIQALIYLKMFYLESNLRSAVP